MRLVIVGSVLLCFMYMSSQLDLNHFRTKGLGNWSTIMTYMCLSADCSFFENSVIFVQCVSKVIFYPSIFWHEIGSNYSL
jgi:hypothetical protein